MPVTLTGMGEILSLGAARERRDRAWRATAERASLHPALRWAAGEPFPAHRRLPGGGTFCGEPGPLTLASPDVELCAECYPVRGAG